MGGRSRLIDFVSIFASISMDAISLDVVFALQHDYRAMVSAGMMQREFGSLSRRGSGVAERLRFLCERLAWVNVLAYLLRRNCLAVVIIRTPFTDVPPYEGSMASFTLDDRQTHPCVSFKVFEVGTPRLRPESCTQTPYAMDAIGQQNLFAIHASSMKLATRILHLPVYDGLLAGDICRRQCFILVRRGSTTQHSIVLYRVYAVIETPYEDYQPWCSLVPKREKDEPGVAVSTQHY